MTTPAPNPQVEHPLQADGGTEEDPIQPPLYSLPHPRTASSVSGMSAGAAAGPLTLPSSPVSSSLASVGGGADSSSESLTNFMKYGTIRPPLSVLQEEFLEKYRSWKEHADPLDGIDGMRSREQSGDVWTSHMANIQKMYARHTPRLSQSQAQGQRYDVGSRLYMSEPRSSLLEESEATCEQKFEDEEKIAADEEDEAKSDDIIENRCQAGDCKRKQLETLAALIFRPGSKLSGAIQHETTSSDYELVVMEGEAADELGQPKGLLARHKFGGDEQCVFVKLCFVTIGTHKDEEKESIEDESESQGEEDASSSSEDDGSDNNNALGTPSETKLTIQIEYVDGDNLIQGLWNHDILCFEGAVVKLSEGQADQNQLGGTIISGLISGHSSFNDGESRSGRMLSSRPKCSDGKRTFSLSPCTHLHPQGVSPAPLWQTLSATLSRILQATQPETSGMPFVVSQDAAAAASHKDDKRKPLTPERRKVLLEEIASLDNYKLVLHRERTGTLRRETLKKLVDLGAVIDFAELARKRNVAKRREKWRGRMRKYTPRLPRQLKRRGRTSTTGGEDYDISKDKPKKVQFFDQLAVISWGGLLEEASIQAEKTCAIFRRQTALLDNLTFESDEYKAQVMVDLRTNGLTLAGSHSEWDRCIQMGRAVALGWSWFERGSWSCFERSAVVGKRCVYLLFQMHSRLEANHKHLEKSFRGADARLTNMQLETIKEGTAHAGSKRNSREGEEDESDGLCGICQCDVDEDEGGNDKEENPSVCLPCSHSFHWECIREWLHNHSQCPICRVDLNTT